MNRLVIRSDVGSNLRTTFDVFNRKGEYLGYFFYYEDWKCNVWTQNVGVVMSSDCLDELSREMGLRR